MNHEDRAAADHVVSAKSYVGVFLFLIAMTITTVLVSYVDLKAWNGVVALTIATMKATAVVLIFMHMRYNHRITQIVIVGALFFLFLLLGLTMTDYLSRGWLSYPNR